MTRAQLVKAFRYLKLLAALRELALLGVNQEQAARMLKVSPAYVSTLKKREGLPFPAPDRSDTPLVAAIRIGYAAGRTPAVLALELHTSSGVIRSVAHQRGIKRAGRIIVPPELKPKYKSLRELGLTPREAGYCLGLLPRPAVKQEIHA